MASRGEHVALQPSRAHSDSSRPLLERFESFLCRCEAHLANPAAWRIAIACSVFFQAALIFTHRPWLDEWQALLIARDTPTLGVMFDQLHYEGHPQLWYLLLRAAGSVFPGDRAFAATNLALAGIALWAILARSPLRRIERLLLATNEILLFEMLTISRSLALGVALIFLALALWRSRFAWLAIALLPLCDFFFGVIACALIAIRIRDRQDKSFPFLGAVLFTASSLVAALAVTPARDVLTTPARGLLAGIVYFCRELGSLALPWQTQLYDTPVSVVLGLFLAPVFLWICSDSLRKDALARLLLFAFLGLLLLFGCAIYPVYFRHAALAAVLLIAFVWIGALQGQRAGKSFNAWLCVAAVCGLATGALNLLVPFDSAAKAASMIRQQKLEKKLWFSFPTFQTLALTGESGVDFGDLERGCGVHFMRWNFRSRITTHAQFFAAVRAAETRHGSYYLVTNVPLPRSIAQPLGTADAGFDGVQYSLWKVGDGPVADANLAPCVAGATSRGAGLIRSD